MDCLNAPSIAFSVIKCAILFSLGYSKWKKRSASQVTAVIPAITDFYLAGHEAIISVLPRIFLGLVGREVMTLYSQTSNDDIFQSQ